MSWLSIARHEDGGPEWRRSDWPVTDNLNGGRACPRCHVTVHRGARWRAHWAYHQRVDARLAAIEQALKELASALRLLAVEAGHADWYPDGGGEDAEDDPEEEPLSGYVIGSGPLPESMRGEEE